MTIIEDHIPNGLIVGISTFQLTSDEISFLQTHQPLGVILFSRNINSPEQVRQLTEAILNTSVHKNMLIFIDQEGGRVQRLKPPHWPQYSAGRSFGAIYKTNENQALRAVYLTNRLIADDLYQLGIQADCTPVLDLEFNETHDVIGDRAYSDSPHVVTKLGAVAIQAMMDGAVLPVMKHIPGHGRAIADSHYELPTLSTSLADLNANDFVPFQAFSNQCPFAMTAHITYSALDPYSPATQSKLIIQHIIRTLIGYKGLIMTDDLSMQALTGTFEERGRLSLEAGCDILLHCNGNMDEMNAVASVSQKLNAEQMKVLNTYMQNSSITPKPFNRNEAMEELNQIMADYTTC